MNFQITDSTNIQGVQDNDVLDCTKVDPKDINTNHIGRLFVFFVRESKFCSRLKAIDDLKELYLAENAMRML